MFKINFCFGLNNDRVILVYLHIFDIMCQILILLKDDTVLAVDLTVSLVNTKRLAVNGGYM